MSRLLWIFLHGFQDRWLFLCLLLKLGRTFTGKRLDTSQTVGGPERVIGELSLPCAHAGGSPESVPFELRAGIGVRFPVKEDLQAVFLPVHLNMTALKLPAGKFRFGPFA